MRRLVLTAAVLTSAFGGSLVAFAPSAHAAGACVNVHIAANGSDVVNQQQCLPPQ